VLNQLDAFTNQISAVEQSGQTTTVVSTVLKTKSDTAKNRIMNMQ
jgi:hypothetical protein